MLKEVATTSGRGGPAEEGGGEEKATTPGNTAWLRVNPAAANQRRRDQETGRGSVRYRLVACSPAGLDETRRGRGPRAKRENSWERK